MAEKKTKGGYTEHKELSKDRNHLPFAVLTMSDTRNEETDKSGQIIKELLLGQGHRVVHYRVVKENPEHIRREISACIQNPEVAVIITNGGTGVAKRDGTFEVVSSLLDKPLTGFGEIFRYLSYADIGSGAMMSRATAGIVGNKVLFAIPGSSGAVRLAMEKLILLEAGHLYWEITK